MTVARTFMRAALRTSAVLAVAGVVIGAFYGIAVPFNDGPATLGPQHWIDRFAPDSLRGAATHMAVQFAILLGAAIVGHRALRRRQ